MFKNTHFAAFAALVSLVGAPLPALAQCAYGDVTSAHCVPFTPPTAYPGFERPSQSQIDAANARRQAKIDRQIEQYRATQYYGVLGISTSRENYIVRGGYKSLNKARDRALSALDTDDARIVATYSNTCLAVAQPNKDLGFTLDNLFIATNTNPNAVFGDALLRCEAQYGKGQCGTWFDGKAHCSGYDYGIYNQ